MTFDVLYSNIRANAYEPKPVPVPFQLPAGYIFDEKESAAWNASKVQENNEERSRALARNRELAATANQQFASDVKSYLMAEYGLSEQKAAIVYSRAYEDGHAGGYYEVLAHAQSLGEFAQSLLRAE